MYFFDLVFLIDYIDYFLTYGNIKMARYECQYLNGWLGIDNLYVNFYIYIAIKFLFSLYVLLFIYF